MNVSSDLSGILVVRAIKFYGEQRNFRVPLNNDEVKVGTDEEGLVCV